MHPERVVKLIVSLGCFAYANIARALRILAGRGVKGHLTILYYHAVSKANAAKFGAQMAFLKNNYVLVAADFAGPLPEGRNAVAVTFDDAFRSVYTNALQILEKENIPVAIFVPTGYLGRSPDWDMDDRESDHGDTVADGELLVRYSPVISYGSHTVSHPRLSRLSDEELVAELRISKRELESVIGRPVNTLAFPYGDHDRRVVQACETAGYRQLFTIVPEKIDPTVNSPLRGRVTIFPHDSGLEFRLKAAGAYSWLHRASELKRSVKMVDTAVRFVRTRFTVR